MTKELSDIVAAFREAHGQGRQTALATVVHVEGSSYRRPGARMLVEDNGKMTGAISGGCLEGDALRKALQAINQQQNKLVTYNTLDNDDLEFGVQLGCNGIVHILFEPIDAASENNPIKILQQCFTRRQDAVLVTLFSLKNYKSFQPGTCQFFNETQTIGKIDNKDLEAEVRDDAGKVLTQKTSILKEYPGFEITGFIELVEPPVTLVIVGAGNDALPLVEMAAILGWETVVVDGRSTHANKNRFAQAKQVVVGKPAEAIKQLQLDERTFAVLMTHNYHYDLEMLGLLVQQKIRYIGSLGPRKKLERMYADLAEKGITVANVQKAAIHGPTGLDIGAETAEEIALSILAEIKAVLSERKGMFLRDRSEAIHTRTEPIMQETRFGK